jgi:hypothetical protein
MIIIATGSKVRVQQICAGGACEQARARGLSRTANRLAFKKRLGAAFNGIQSDPEILSKPDRFAYYCKCDLIARTGVLGAGFNYALVRMVKVAFGQAALKRLTRRVFRRPGHRDKSWSRKSEQDDKWSFCLIAGTLCPANQERQ